MAQPLTKEWIEALAEAAHGRFVAEGIALVLEYQVVDGPTWPLVVANGTVQVQFGPAQTPDVSFHTQRSTALAMANGSLDPLKAVIDGDLILQGDPRKLVAAKNLLEDLGDLLASD